MCDSCGNSNVAFECENLHRTLIFDEHLVPTEETIIIKKNVDM